MVENCHILPFSSGPKLMGEERVEAAMAGEHWEGGEVALIGAVQSMLCLQALDSWSFGDVASILVSDWRSLTKFAMYSLRLAEFDEVCYVQPPVGKV
uniref:Uncharacterized protein n=1 Tax=Solanum tuberosum TaxID=4113 RepID=M1DJV6_SOLTU